MRFLISTLLLGLGAFATADAQTARVQIINNSPADAIDVYIGDQLVADNFAFRTATPYIDVPSGDVKVGIAAANSVSYLDATPIDVNFPNGSTSVMMATGTQGGSPGFDLKSYWTALEASPNPATTSVLWYHGSGNAGPIDVFENGGSLIDDFSYGYYHGYFDLNGGQYKIDLTHPTDAAQVIGSYALDVSNFAGKSIVVMGSGLVNDATYGFAPWAVLPDGTTFALPLWISGQPGPAGASTVQFVHNAPSATVDVYVDGQLLIDDFAYKTATEFIEIPAGTVTLAIADRNSVSAVDAVATTTLTTDSTQQHIVFVNGNLDPAVLVPPSNLSLSTFSPARQEALTLDQVGVLFYNGMNNGTTISVDAAGTPWAANTAAGAFGADYNDVTANQAYIIDLTDGGGVAMGSYNVDLSWWHGKTATIFAGPGYVDPSTTELWVALSNGGTFPLQAISNQPNATARVQLIHNAPTATVDVYVNGQLTLDDFAWRTATPFMTLPAGTPIDVAIAPASSTSVADALVTLPVNLTPDKTYIAVADGMMDGTTPNFAINFIDYGRETATDANNVDLVYYHGMMNDTAIDFMLGDVVQLDNAGFGDFGPAYLSLTPDASLPFLFSLTDPNDNTNVLGAYDADFSWWKGGSAVLFSGRGYQDQNADETEIWVALSNGGTYPLPKHVPSPLIVFSGAVPANTFPNPAQTQVNVQLVLPTDSQVQAQLMSAQGTIFSSLHYGAMPQGLNTMQFDVSNLPTGQYYITMITNAGLQTIPVAVKQD